MKSKKSIYNIIKNNQFILNYISNASPFFILITILVTLTAFVDTLSTTWLSKVVFDGMSKGTSYSEIVKIVLFLLVLLLLSSFIRTYYDQKKAVIEREKIRTYIRTKVLLKTKELDFECFEDPAFYDQYTRAMSEADSRASAVIDSISSLFYSLITLATLFAIIILLDPILFFFAIIGVILSFIINTYLGKLRYQYNNERTSDERGLNYIHRIFYEPQYAQNIKMDTMVAYFIGQYRSLAEHLVQIIKKRANKITVLEFLSQIQNIVMQTIMILFLTYRVFKGILTVGDYAALLNSTFSLMFQLNYLFGLIPQFYQHSLFIENLRKVMEYQPKIEKDEGNMLEKAESYSIEFKNVYFKYPNQDQYILNNVSFCLQTGESIALVGHNGAGKSTIVKLMIRLYDVSQGSVLVNGNDIRSYNVYSLRRCFSTVFQDCQLYAASIADNILGKVYTPEQKKLIEDALTLSGLYEKVNKMPNGIQTQISKEFDERGVLLSGGEVQKLALAKVFAKESPFVILDEPSSALDPISEHELNENMLKAGQDKAVMLISHRLSTTKSSSKIYLLDHGAIVEEGTHKQLMEFNGLYKKMFTVQAENYQMENRSE